MLQVDSVNVLQRAHYMPLFSRMGPYDTEMLKRASERKPRRMVEYWAHVQAFMPVDLWPVMQPPDGRRSARARGGAPGCRPTAGWSTGCTTRCASAAPRRRATSTTAPRASKVDWGWNWSEARKALDYLYLVGDLAIAGRNAQFEPVYDLPERVLPARRAGRAGARRRSRRPRSWSVARPAATAWPRCAA